MEKEWKKPEIKNLNVTVGVLAKSPFEGPPGEGPPSPEPEKPSG